MLTFAVAYSVLPAHVFVEAVPRMAVHKDVRMRVTHIGLGSPTPLSDNDARCMCQGLPDSPSCAWKLRRFYLAMAGGKYLLDAKVAQLYRDIKR